MMFKSKDIPFNFDAEGCQTELWNCIKHIFNKEKEI